LTENEEYTIHNDYDKIARAISELLEIDQETTIKLTEVVSKIRVIDNKLKPAMKKQTFSQNEQELWKTYPSFLEAPANSICPVRTNPMLVSKGLWKLISAKMKD